MCFLREGSFLLECDAVSDELFPHDPKDRKQSTKTFLVSFIP